MECSIIISQQERSYKIQSLNTKKNTDKTEAIDGATYSLCGKNKRNWKAEKNGLIQRLLERK
jgi:hypothetical protein